MEDDSHRSLVDLDRALELDPELADAYYLRGLVRANRHEYEQAIRDLAIYLVLAPDGLYRAVIVQTIHEVQTELSARYSLYAYELLRQGRMEGAMAGFETAIRLSPNNADAYHGRGLVLAATGDPTRALADFSHAIALAPETANFYRHRAQSQRSLGHHDLAAQDDATAAAYAPSVALVNCRGAEAFGRNAGATPPAPPADSASRFAHSRCDHRD